MTHHDPWSPLAGFPDLGAELKQFFGQQPLARHDLPLVNIWIGDESVVVTAEVPGVAVEALDVEVEGDTLTLRGERPEEATGEGCRHQRRERGHGPFARTVRLPYQVDPASTAARLHAGVLEIELRRERGPTHHRVPISTS